MSGWEGSAAWRMINHDKSLELLLGALSSQVSLWQKSGLQAAQRVDRWGAWARWTVCWGGLDRWTGGLFPRSELLQLFPFIASWEATAKYGTSQKLPRYHAFEHENWLGYLQVFGRVDLAYLTFLAFLVYQKNRRFSSAAGLRRAAGGLDPLRRLHVARRARAGLPGGLGEVGGDGAGGDGAKVFWFVL